jgi:anhydro-N-acetylmuramic acid kinase
MIYRAIGLMSGSSLDGLDIAYAEFQENGGKWSFEIKQTACSVYDPGWVDRLKKASSLSALDYQLLHAEYGHYIGQRVNDFIEEHRLHYQVALIASHGHTSFHLPSKKMTAQLGDGAAIAAETKLPVVTDLRALDIAFDGQGAPIVPIGEKMLWSGYDFFLNIGGIANISARTHPNPLQMERTSGTPDDEKSLQISGSSKPPSPKGEGGLGDEVYIAFDICPANRVLNMLANDAGKIYDEGGELAAGGSVNAALLEKLDQLDYYKRPFPKSLSNEFGTDIIYPMIKESGCTIPDALRTCVEHIAIQLISSIKNIQYSTGNIQYSTDKPPPLGDGGKLLATGGGAFNKFLMSRITDLLKGINLPAGQTGIEVVIPGANLVNYKEALIMAFIGVLRWRQENNVLSSVTGATRDSIGGALWTGQEA